LTEKLAVITKQRLVIKAAILLSEALTEKLAVVIRQRLVIKAAILLSETLIENWRLLLGSVW